MNEKLSLNLEHPGDFSEINRYFFIFQFRLNFFFLLDVSPSVPVSVLFHRYQLSVSYRKSR